MGTKICTCCKDTLPASNEYFNKSKNGAAGLTSMCKICISVLYFRNSEAILQSRKKYQIENKEKISRAKKVRRLANLEAIREQSRLSYLRCRETRIAYARSYNKRNSDMIRTRGLEKKFSISEFEIQNKMNQQMGCCAICNKSLVTPKSIRSYAIDHNHQTGIVRGLLCQNCNTSLGLLEENTEILKSSIKYLEKYNGS